MWGSYDIKEKVNQFFHFVEDNIWGVVEGDGVRGWSDVSTGTMSIVRPWSMVNRGALV